MNIGSCSTRKACPTARQHIKCPICEEAMQNRIPCGLRRRRKPQKPKGMGNVWCRQYPYTPIQTEAKETHSAKGVHETATCRFHSRQCTSLYSPPATCHLPHATYHLLLHIINRPYPTQTPLSFPFRCPCPCPSPLDDGNLTPA